MKNWITEDAHLDQVRHSPSNLPPAADWLTLAAGVGIWLVTRGHPSTLLRIAASVGAAAVVSKTTPGRRALATVLRAVPFRHRMS